MRTIVTVFVFAVGILGNPQRAHAQVSNVTVLLKISIDPSVGGTAIGAASGLLDGVPASIEEAAWTDTHSERSPLFEAGLAFRSGDFAEILGLLNVGSAGADTDAYSIGEVGGVPLLAAFDDYEFWGLEGGVRLRPASGVGPYATFTGGFRRVSEIQARLRVGSTFLATTGYEASTVPSFTAGGGILWGSDDFAMGFEVALRYAGSLKVPAGRAPRAGARRWRSMVVASRPGLQVLTPHEDGGVSAVTRRIRAGPAIVLAGMLVSPSHVAAQRVRDEVVDLSNGDRVTGEIKGLDRSQLTVRTS